MTNLPTVQTDPYQEMERADEQMVLDEIKGRAMDALVYEIKQGGQTVTGLSLSGVRETARVMNSNGKARIGISDREPVITETDDYFEVKVFAQDTMNGGGYWGMKRQSKKYGQGGTNQFALEQALAKAQRNALRGLIPEWFVKEMIEAWRKNGQVKTISKPAPVMRAPIPQPPKVEAPQKQEAMAISETPRVTNANELLVAANALTNDHYKNIFQMKNALAVKDWPAPADTETWQKYLVVLVDRVNAEAQLAAA